MGDGSTGAGGKVAKVGQPSIIPDGNNKPAIAADIGLSRKEVHEARAKMRLAEEYDAAQERGEIAKSGFKGNQWSVPEENAPPTAAEIGISRKDIHEARQIRDAELAEPGVTARVVGEIVSRGEEPTKARVNREIIPKPKPAPLSIPRPRSRLLASEAWPRCRPDR